MEANRIEKSSNITICKLGASHLLLIAASFDRYVSRSLATYARC